jgi:hypothetical protein
MKISTPGVVTMQDGTELLAAPKRQPLVEPIEGFEFMTVDEMILAQQRRTQILPTPPREPADAHLRDDTK